MEKGNVLIAAGHQAEQVQLSPSEDKPCQLLVKIVIGAEGLDALAWEHLGDHTTFLKNDL